MIAHTFFCLENRLLSEARNVTQILEAHLHYTNVFRELLLFCTVVLDNEAHETSASWSYTFLGYTPNALGRTVSVEMARKTHHNYTTIIVGNLVS